MSALSGLRIVVTRAAHQAEELARPLRQLGATVLLLPVIGIAPAADPEPLKRAVSELEAYDWIILSSANAVEVFTRELSGSRPARARIAAVGSATRDAAERSGLHVHLVPQKYVAESLVDSFSALDLNGRRVLIPSAAVTRDVVAPELRKRGAQVDVVEAYRNVLPPEAVERAREIFRDPYPDWVLFASSSAVDHLISLTGIDALRQVRIASIGPATSTTIRKYGLPLAAEADPHSIPGLIEAVKRAMA
ncbi:MAG: uroporphyrinogen-III synthase [Acidobacteriaceae bacterium]|nr:uroporphyrinogen-III synthase [Acidobacteriaceae bacterium]